MNWIWPSLSPSLPPSLSLYRVISTSPPFPTWFRATWLRPPPPPDPIQLFQPNSQKVLTRRTSLHLLISTKSLVSPISTESPYKTWLVEVEVSSYTSTQVLYWSGRNELTNRASVSELISEEDSFDDVQLILEDDDRPIMMTGFGSESPPNTGLRDDDNSIMEEMELKEPSCLLWKH